MTPVQLIYKHGSYTELKNDLLISTSEENIIPDWDWFSLSHLPARSGLEVTPGALAKSV
jgi:hypothetical protein